MSEDSLPDEALEPNQEQATPVERPLPAIRPQPPGGVEFETESYQQGARGRITAFPFALGLITLGGLLLLESQIENFEVTLPMAGLILVAALVLTNLFRFFVSGRRERGLFFLALFTLSLGAVLALMSIAGETFEADHWWPLVFIGSAGALILTFLAEREHERGLLGLAVLLLVAGGVALAVTLEVIPQDAVDTIADYFPLVIAFIGVTLIPLALRRSAE
jgi:uncharacterized membrane protein